MAFSAGFAFASARLFLASAARAFFAFARYCASCCGVVGFLGPAGALAGLDPNAVTVVYCAVGVRSLRGAQLLRDRHGFQRTVNLRDGYSEWRRLARFTYKSGREAAWAATNFAWVMGRIATISLLPAFLPT